MKFTFKIVWLLCIMVGLLHISNKVEAQVTIEMKMDTSMLLIGDQTNLTIEATFPDSFNVMLPMFSDTIIDKLEIINISDIDTILENNTYKISQKYLVTSFDSGWYAIPPANFVLSFGKLNYVDTLKSNPLYFGVMTVPLDTVNVNAIADIKKPIGAPISFREVLPFLLILIFNTTLILE